MMPPSESGASEAAPVRPTVLHVLEALEGGTARHLVDVVRHTPVAHEVAVPRFRMGGVTDLAAVEAMAEAGAVVHRVEMRRLPPHPLNLAALVAIRRLIARRRPHLVHGHSSVGGALARLAVLVAPSRRPPGVLYTPNGVAAGPETPGGRPALVLERALGRGTDRLVAVSPSEADLVRRLRLVPAHRVVTIPNGIELDLPPPGPDLRAALGLMAGVPLVGCVARLVPQKRPVDFVRAAVLVAQQVAGAHFVHIGDGPLRAAMGAEIRRSGLGSRFHLVAELPGAAAVLGQMDVVVLASAFEGGPYVPLEAMRAGTPVVLSDVVGNRDVVEDAVSGLLVPPGDPPALAAAVVRVLDEPGLRARLAEAARARVGERFDVRAMGLALAAVYRQVGQE